MLILAVKIIAALIVIGAVIAAAAVIQLDDPPYPFV